MNTLLKRQIVKFINPEHLKDLKYFLQAVNESYDNHEDQMSMFQRAMKISSDELFEANKKLREEANSLKEINSNLTEILNSMNLDAEKLGNEKDFNQSDFLKKQSIEIVAMNKQREELLLSLENQNRELNEYAHVVSHDLKAPLRNIDTLINWVLEDNKDLMRQSCLSSLNQVLLNVEKMDLLIKGILDYSTVDKVESEERLIDFNLVIDEIKREIHTPKNIKISIINDLPKIKGNSWRFKQLMQNLIENSIHYNNKAQGQIEIGCTEKEQDFEFYIKDNGVGIAEKYHGKIFKIFTKLENNNQNSGVGLSIVNKIIEYYKGSIRLESKENIGTTFYFTLPKNYGGA
ncbi:MULTISPECIES: sensor histidine kinase [Flavobacterium]|jgi:light-regulated signal transduction histidine kinase (bacteriophytochrome)|uniref:histidine kinase n=2 Tax=Flavobacterium TaxID=237 RepID=A0A1S1JB96_9FLAO|nr:MULTISPECIES: ATP-binding protein [Flavobacterium]MCC9020502.1 GHKL domain-containing protein [Flavobacterium sp. F-126]MDL2145480.1 ATP-binding protein [Flavobacterium tructae]OHT47070.1 two-component sensor histidine kinase [Flavobacterium tructae]OXB15743.1 two-component sensor histidine kinase [Flavobacterium tructae]GIQ61259.1 two-component sensor histidine kinase [Flavobacterium collinsii]